VGGVQNGQEHRLSDKGGEVPLAPSEPNVDTDIRTDGDRLQDRGYAHPWPDALPELGLRTVGPFAPCACGRWSWVRYGDAVLCLPCANAERQR
jgi:hypothetical protein